MRRTWEYAAMMKDEGNATDGRFSATCERDKVERRTQAVLLFCPIPAQKFHTPAWSKSVWPRNPLRISFFPQSTFDRNAPRPQRQPAATSASTAGAPCFAKTLRGASARRASPVFQDGVPALNLTWYRAGRRMHDETTLSESVAL